MRYIFVILTIFLFVGCSTKKEETLYLQHNPKAKKDVLILEKQKLEIIKELNDIEKLKKSKNPTEEDLIRIDQEGILKLSLGYLNGNISIIKVP